ncbi:hypothetical protein V1478_002653 [Vespula squamosa]|uniref:Uncharacterized protein n=1 Tax=Vespula squamosa TaxID=30214 RepID=A0ABD2BT58_VESSQ
MTFVVRWYDDVEAANNTESLTGSSRVTLPLGRIAKWPIGFEVGVIYGVLRGVVHGVWNGRGICCLQ